MQIIIALCNQYLTPFLTRHSTWVAGTGLACKAVYDLSVADYAAAYHDAMLSLGAFGVTLGFATVVGHVAKK